MGHLDRTDNFSYCTAYLPFVNPILGPVTTCDYLLVAGVTDEVTAVERHAVA